MNPSNHLSISLQERNLEALVSNNGFRFSDTFFIYTSGKIGPYYVNSEVITKNAQDYADAVNAISLLISTTIGNDEYDVISGGESRDWIFSYPVAVQERKPHVSIYKDKRVIGGEIKDNRVLHISDLNNEGTSPKDLWVPSIRENGGSVNDIFFYVDRLEDGVKVMGELGLKSRAVVPLDESAWDYLKKIGAVSEEVYVSLRKRMEDKEEWASRMLLSDLGLKQLAEYFQQESRMKGRVEKILNVGYPDLKEEIFDRLEDKYSCELI